LPNPCKRPGKPGCSCKSPKAFALTGFSCKNTIHQEGREKSFCINFYTKIGVGNSAEIGLEKEEKLHGKTEKSMVWEVHHNL
jgi:hypothetical protein